MTVTQKTPLSSDHHRKLVLTGLTLMFAATAPALASQKAHVHGAGKLSLAVDGKLAMVQLQIPAHDIVGFEHQPKNDKQKKAVADAIQTFKTQVTKVIRFETAYGCTPSHVEVVALGLDDKHSHGSKKAKKADKHDHDDHDDHNDNDKKKDKHDHDDHDDHNDNDVHSEFDVDYKFTCSKPLKGTVQTDLIGLFPRLKIVEAVVLSESGQKSLNLKKPSESFEL